MPSSSVTFINLQLRKLRKSVNGFASFSWTSDFVEKKFDRLKWKKCHWCDTLKLGEISYNLSKRKLESYKQQQQNLFTKSWNHDQG